MIGSESEHGAASVFSRLAEIMFSDFRSLTSASLGFRCMIAKPSPLSALLPQPRRYIFASLGFRQIYKKH